MRRSLISFSIALGLVTTMPSLVSAIGPFRMFDGNRRGFIAGVDVGTGWTRFAASNDSVAVSETRMTYAYGFRIGVAPSDYWQIYFAYRTSVYLPEMAESFKAYSRRINTNTEDGRLHLAGALFAYPFIALFSDQHWLGSSLGVRYYSRPVSPSFFTDFGFGGGAVATPWDSDMSPAPPSELPALYSFFAGFGWEFRNRLSLSVNGMYSFGWDKGFGDNDRNDFYDGLSFTMMIGTTGY